MSELNGVDKELARKELEALMASRLFDRAPNMGVLFQWVCNKALEGRVEEIKEYNIAVEAFGRPPDFDKRRDSIVRVEAHRLRKRLLQYYEHEDGVGHEVRIQIPPGQYSPVFVRRTTPLDEVVASPALTEPAPDPEATAVAVPASQSPRRNPVTWVVAAALCIAAAAAIYFPRRHEAASKAAQSPRAASADRAVVIPGSGSDLVRIMAGSITPAYTDTLGASWSQDRYFTGGNTGVVPFRRISGTADPMVYLKRREGDFRYDIPLKPGVYELRLHFAETRYGEGNVDGGGETSRLFNVTANDRTILDEFDVVSDAAGPNTADIKVFKDVQPASDGVLHLHFASQKGLAFVNAIEITPGDRGKLRPLRFLARASGYTDSQGRVWSPESYWNGGRVVLRQEEVRATPDPGIYQSERYGNFSYAIPLAPGSYTAVLHFAESWHGPGREEGGGVGSRVFDVFCNRVVLLKDFDIFAEAKGDYRALAKTFNGLRPNAQGKLLLSFVPTRNYACINALEVIDEGR